MKKIVQLFALLVLINGCKKEEKLKEPIRSYLNGAFVSNEGSFGSNNAGISHISLTGALTNDVYLSANGVELGDVLQSFTVIGSRGYAVMNNSQKVEVINLADMKRVASITGLSYPRRLVQIDAQTAFLTNGNFGGEVVILDLTTNTVLGSITVGNGPENITRSGNAVFVCNSGGWAEDNTVSVIDINSQSVVQTITVGDVPFDAVTDQTGDVWILCRGKVIYDQSWNIIGHSDAMIYRIDGTTFDVETSLNIGSNGDHPSHLEINPAGDVLYLENSGIYSMSIDADSWTSLIVGAFNSLNVHPVSGDFWCAAIPNFVSPTPVYNYTSSGILLNTYITGIGANGVSFN